MIYITGDTHGDFSRFYSEENSFLKNLTKNDYVIICGDFGGVWDGSEEENKKLDELNELPFTILFVDGNHENFDLLEQYKLDEWNGDLVQFIRPSVIHLMRCAVYTIDGKKILTMGGGKSHDVSDGILDKSDRYFESKLKWMKRNYRQYYRINHESWWKQEVPSEYEWAILFRMIKIHDKVDFVITHSCPSEILDKISNGFYEHDEVTEGLQRIYNKISFKKWYFGHYHENIKVDDRFELLYGRIEKLEE